MRESLLVLHSLLQWLVLGGGVAVACSVARKALRKGHSCLPPRWPTKCHLARSQTPNPEHIAGEFMTFLNRTARHRANQNRVRQVTIEPCQ